MATHLCKKTIILFSALFTLNVHTAMEPMSTRAINLSTTRARARNGRFKSRIKKELRTCARCATRQTCQWRTGKGTCSLCNACGMKYIRERKKEIELISSESLQTTSEEIVGGGTAFLKTQEGEAQVKVQETTISPMHDDFMGYLFDSDNIFPPSISY